mmetsp:Transcript_14884/g.51487  ORF Transcript_14884/g.51487 Transcript_14884/m.51487 type:complete len:294 (-) Transcript_14884:1258-2139(-)
MRSSKQPGMRRAPSGCSPYAASMTNRKPCVRFTHSIRPHSSSRMTTAKVRRCSFRRRASSSASSSRFTTSLKSLTRASFRRSPSFSRLQRTRTIRPFDASNVSFFGFAFDFMTMMLSWNLSTRGESSGNRGQSGPPPLPRGAIAAVSAARVGTSRPRAALTCFPMRRMSTVAAESGGTCLATAMRSAKSCFAPWSIFCVFAASRAWASLFWRRFAANEKSSLPTFLRSGFKDCVKPVTDQTASSGCAWRMIANNSDTPRMSDGFGCAARLTSWGVTVYQTAAGMDSDARRTTS